MSVPAESLSKRLCFLLLSTALSPHPYGDNGQMSPVVARTGSSPALLPERAVSAGVSGSKQLLFNK
ncbi:hypothetical protein EMIT0215P_10216 [Pseudomonas serboccidentalis]